jgi:hypothetical protein
VDEELPGDGGNDEPHQEPGDDADRGGVWGP